MRLLAAFALLLICATGHTAAVICPDGLTYVDTNTALCPVNSTGISVLNIEQTTANIQATGDAQATSSTGYHWTSASQFPSGCTSLNYTYADLASGVTATRQAAEKARQKCANFKVMTAGTGAVSFGSAAISVPGAYAVSITGLTAATTYYTQHWVAGGVGGAGKIGKLSTQEFATNESGAAPGETFVADSGAAPRYVGTGGNDASDGLTHATRWLTLSKITGALPAGTNVGIFNTTTFTNQTLSLSHGGTSLDYNIVGSYKLNGSGVPIWIVDGVNGYGSTDTKAIIQGGLTDGCITAGTCTFPTTGFPVDSVLYSEYQPYIRIEATADYTEVRNLACNYARYFCLHAVGVNQNNPGSLHHIIIDGFDSFKSGFGSPVVTSDGVTDVVVRNGTGDQINLCEDIKLLGTSSNTSACNGGGWPGGYYTITRSTGARFLVENNTVTRVFGEGYNCFNVSASYGIFRGNRASNTHSNSIYVDGCTNVVIENNILLGGDGNTGVHDGGEPSFIGVYISSEDVGYPNATGNVIRNNLMVGQSTGIEGSQFPDVVTAGDTIGAKIYNNTVIDAKVYDTRVYSANIAEWAYTNNANWNQDITAANTCQSTSPPDFVDNHWYTAPSDTDCTGAGDTTGDPGLTVSTYATWQSRGAQDGVYTTITWPTFADVNPAGGSALLGTGTALSSSILDISNYGIAFTQIAEVISGALTEAEWECANCVDALGATRASPPSKGAVE